MNYSYAGFWTRFLAMLIDGLVMGMATFAVILVLMLFMGTGARNNPSEGVIVDIISLGFYLWYMVFFQAQTGQTLGKKAMKIKVVSAAGTRPSAGTFFLREILGKWISGLILDIGYLIMIWDKNKQTLHDKIAGTYVIVVGENTSVPVAPAPPLPTAPEQQSVSVSQTPPQN